MKINRVVVGDLEENCYILEKDGHALIIDPGDESSRIIQNIDVSNVDKILITHQHFDHVGAVCDIMKLYKVEKMEYENTEEKEYSVGPFHFLVIHTPGHTKDSISFYFPKEKVMFVGDFVFQGTVGRWDLETGDFSMMQESIQKLKKYDQDITLYPGHGPFTTLAQEILENPYFK